MKRIDMIAEIKSLMDNEILEIPNSSYLQRLDYAEHILNHIEKLGMLPPDVCQTDRGYDNKKFVNHKYMDLDLHYWEKEND